MSYTLNLILAYIIHGYAQTTTTTCQNDPKIYKLDIREQLTHLPADSTVANIDPLNLCQQILDYDYVWLTQLWTPSRYNYQNNVNAEVSNSYSITQNIKEYELDPALGTSSDFLIFQQQLKQVCHHVKFLGEFSFYVGVDSTLVFNNTRFLQIPYTLKSGNYNDRYDNDGFIWAVNDNGRTIPYTAVWNLFDKDSIEDIKDIIYRQILLQYNLDGIVFLQPSLGLYNFNLQFYQPEVQFFGQTSYLQDFYINFGLKFTDNKYYFMGGEDNMNNELQLLNIGLQQIFKSRTNDYYVWQDSNFTFDPTKRYYKITTDDVTIYGASSRTYWSFAMVSQSQSTTQKSCFRINITQSGIPSVGLGSISKMQSNGYWSSHFSMNHGEYAIFAGNYMSKSDDSNLKWGPYGFTTYANDQIEAQYDPINKILKFIRFGTKISYSYYIEASPSSLRYMAGVYDAHDQMKISFPFYFSQLYKSAQASVKGDRNLLAISSNQTLQYAQIEPSINQFNITRLKILIQNIPSGLVGVGVCDRDLMNFKKHIANIQLGWGAYLVFHDGLVQHSDSNTYNNKVQDFTFTSNSMIQITYNPNTKELTFQDTNSNSYIMVISRKIKNINFCVAFNNQNTAFYLSY